MSLDKPSHPLALLEMATKSLLKFDYEHKDYLNTLPEPLKSHQRALNKEGRQALELLAGAIQELLKENEALAITLDMIQVAIDKGEGTDKVKEILSGLIGVLRNQENRPPS